MSDKPISVGDLVVLLRNHCSDDHVGQFFTVGEFRHHSICLCGKCSGEIPGQVLAIAPWSFGVGGYPLPWLKRIPPLDELEGEKRDEEITA